LHNVEGPYRLSQLLRDEYREKLILGWNLATLQAFYEQFKRQGYKSFKKNKRNIDINCRLNLRKDFPSGSRWFYFHRSSTINELGKLNGKYKIIATDEYVPHKVYLNELKNSKICISPFGLGEINRKDFEAIINGCLLIKPSMERMVTEPDLFIPNQTYVPVKWDMSDLNEKCEYYLTHNEERERVIKNAEQAYARYFKEKRFVE
ncbi:unnamed protein product, partial [marine sediment metagenome]